METYYHRPIPEEYQGKIVEGVWLDEHDSIPPSEPTLPAMPIWQARSFWLALTTAAALVANIFGVDFDENLLAERVLNVVPLVTFALAYRERLNPSRRLTGRK
jgi:hypothetical protein